MGRVCNNESDLIAYAHWFAKQILCDQEKMALLSDILTSRAKAGHTPRHRLCGRSGQIAVPLGRGLTSYLDVNMIN